ncbi:MAG: hypothetical protein WCP26_02150 [Actinomycetes bacterium]
MERVAARCAVALLGLVALFQIALVAGAPWGAFTQGGQTSGTLPLAGRLLAALSIVVVLVMALAILARAGLGPMARAPRRLITVLTWFTMIYSLLAIVANTASQSASERMLWAPFSLVLAIVIGFVMWRTRRGEVVHASDVD